MLLSAQSSVERFWTQDTHNGLCVAYGPRPGSGHTKWTGMPRSWQETRAASEDITRGPDLRRGQLTRRRNHLRREDGVPRSGTVRHIDSPYIDMPHASGPPVLLPASEGHPKPHRRAARRQDRVLSLGASEPGQNTEYHIQR